MYLKRIIRGNEYYITSKLGAYGADLVAVSCFFEKPWSKPASDMKEGDQAHVLNMAGTDLRALGRLSEVSEPSEAALAWANEKEEWDKAAKQYGNLSELYLTLGEIDKAVEYARKSVERADNSKDEFERCSKRTTLADALHNSSKSAEAKELFEEAEEMQKEIQPEFPYLYSLWGFRFCDLLLSQCQYKEVMKRSIKILSMARQATGVSLLDLAFVYLSIGYANLLEAVRQNKKGKGKISVWEAEGGSLEKAEDFLNQAVDGLREAGVQEVIVLSLLALAELNRYKQDFEKASVDLEEAREIAERGQMNLYMADYHLEAARLCLSEGNKEKEARGHYEEAANRIKYMGYHRRDPEVLLIQAELEIIESDKKSARETLKKAKKRIDEMGCHRWDVEVERLKELLKKATKTK